MATTSIPPLLDELVRAGGPSGHEGAATSIWRRAASFARLESDGIGSSIARVGTGKPLVAIFGHIDEIGLIVTHIDERGNLWFAPIGVWDPQILIGQRVTVTTRGGAVPGVIGRKPVHLLIGTDQLKQSPDLADLCIDIGVATAAEALELVEIGDTAVPTAEPLSLAGDRVVSKSMDNRAGAYIALESLRRCAEGAGPSGSFAAVASTQEETGFFGARTSSFALRPDVAIVVDACVESDSQGIDQRQIGIHPFGSGPVIGRGPNLSPAVADLLIETAKREGIGHTVAAYGSSAFFPGEITGTDADGLHHTAGGIPTGLVSFPLRYMHSSVEMVDLRDIEAVVRLLVAAGPILGAGDLELGPA